MISMEQIDFPISGSFHEAAIVVPIFNECKNIKALYDRLNSVTSAEMHIRWRYIFVNDGSTDDSYSVLKSLAESDPKICVLDLSRNFGKEAAMTAGVDEASEADFLICLDADLQHPPEYIPEMIALWRSGAEIVVSIRDYTSRQPLLRVLGSKLFYWIMKRFSGLKIDAQTTDFRLYDKKVLDAFRLTTERERLFRGIMDWLGFRRRYLHFEADSRNDGAPRYSYLNLIKLALNSVFSFSLWPLRVAAILGWVIVSLSGPLLLWMGCNYLLGGQAGYTGVAIVVVANMFLIGIVLVALGLVAAYVGKIHIEVANRPLYLLRERIEKNKRA